MTGTGSRVGSGSLAGAGSRAGVRRDWVAMLVVVACAVILSGVRGRLAERFDAIGVASDTYALPPPEHTAVMSLGFRAAVADFIWAHVMVSYGLHFQKKRRFEHIADYLETVMYLDPSFAQPYLYADTMLTIQPVPPREQDYDKAKELLLKGTQALPYHQQVWFVAGQFIAYVAPPHLKDPEKQARWRVEGAKVLARACELATDNNRIPHHCIVAATLLSKAGEREALIQMLTRTLAVNDDPQIQELAASALREWGDEQERAEDVRRQTELQALAKADLPYASKELLLLLGPRVDVYDCVGRDVMTLESARCNASWRQWSENFSARARQSLQHSK